MGYSSIAGEIPKTKNVMLRGKVALGHYVLALKPLDPRNGLQVDVADAPVQDVERAENDP